ncbi:hypothetical protein LAG90_07900 [Marinilongibacter aquaticus]|uniref:hypothetical protein n=1 Tax=Marinilongibacter aquaticus TaxID=2975157 RepID=UPI0021BD138F|nr:hypothetical protein [Marinilongibacter aquaticus]UBM60563.1 hypothetical protein LAG90_07900 [Marinilongibacter aquaticus]
MYTLFRITLFLVLCPAVLFSQEFDFGKIKSEDFEIDLSSIEDTTAEAVIIKEYAEVNYIYNEQRGFEIVTVTHVLKKILKTTGLEHGDVTIPILIGPSRSKSETVYRVHAMTHNLEKGKVEHTELGKKDIFREELSERVNLLKFSLPEVRIGSIVEYQYTRQTPVNVYNKPRTWYFQHDIPCLWSEIDLVIPSFFTYHTILSGYIPLEKQESKEISYSLPGANMRVNAWHQQFAVKNAPAFKEEPYITTTEDYISKIEFDLSTFRLPNEAEKNFNLTWEDLNKTLIESETWGSKLDRANNFLKDEVQPFLAIEEPMARVEAIYDYLTRTYMWNQEAGLWFNRNLKDIASSQRGSASELNVLATVFFRKCGIEANPAILSTRSHGKINQMFPLLDKFNYTVALVQVNDTKIPIDITEPLLPLTLLPLRCRNGAIFEVTKNGGNFIDLDESAKYHNFEKLEIEIDPTSEKVSGIYEGHKKDYAALKNRKVLHEVGENEFASEIKKLKSDWEVENFEVHNSNDKNESLDIGYEFSWDAPEYNADLIYVSPFLFLQWKDNPFKRRERAFPVDIGYTLFDGTSVTFKTPEGYEIEEVPENANVVLPNKGGRFRYSIAKMNGGVTVNFQCILNKPIYHSQEYPYLKELYSRIIEKQSEMIVFKKKGK